MGLYLCVFHIDEELDGVEVGPYADFNALRDYVIFELEAGIAGSKFPTFIIHSDSDGEWSVADSAKLEVELMEIILAMKKKPPMPLVSDWQKAVAKSIGLIPRSAFESFLDVDGEFVLERMHSLTAVSLERQLPILFQ